MHEDLYEIKPHISIHKKASHCLYNRMLIHYSLDLAIRIKRASSAKATAVEAT